MPPRIGVRGTMSGSHPHSLMNAFSHVLSGARWRLALLTVVLVSAGVAAGVAGALTASSPTQKHPDSGGPVRGREVVASGSTPGHGPWRLLRSQDAQGQECLGLEVGKQPPGDVTVVFESCGGPSGMNVGTLGGDGETIIWGRVPDAAEDVRISATGRAAQTLATTQGSAGVGGRFVVGAIQGRLHGVLADARDGAGRQIASQSVGTPSAEE